MKFNENLKTLRKEAGLTQEELAEKLNVSRQAVTKWESGQAMPDIVNLKEIAYLFSVTTDSLLEDIECRGTTKLKKKIDDIGWFVFGYTIIAIFFIIIPISGFVEQVTNDEGATFISIVVMALISMILLGVFIKKYLTNNKKKILNMSQTEEGKRERKRFIIKNCIINFVSLTILLGISNVMLIPEGTQAFFTGVLDTLKFTSFCTIIEMIVITKKLNKKVKELNQ